MSRFHDNTEGGQQSVTTRAALAELMDLLRKHEQTPGDIATGWG
jgi:hypothetical protein